MSKQQLVDELHKQARRNFPRRKVVLKGLRDLWQADLVEMIPYASVNRGFKYLLVVIDCFSKVAYAEPLKSKQANDITDGFVKVLKSAKGQAPKHLQVDNGSEFYNRTFLPLLKRHGINMYSSFSSKKASIVERLNRTLKSKMWKRFSLQGSYKWLDLLAPILNEYNNSVHTTIGMKPIDVAAKDVKKISRRLARKQLKVKPQRRRFKVGDYVRMSKEKAIFEKGYTPNWSAEVMKVVKVQKTQPVTYLLEDLRGNPIKGGFYHPELQKTRVKDIYLVERVLRKRGERVYVKWWGFDETHNSWINKEDLV